MSNDDAPGGAGGKGLKRKAAKGGATSVAASAAGGGGKRPKMVGLCTCSCCGQKSSETDWAHFVSNKKTGAKEAADDKCKECWGRFVEGGYSGYMEWPQYCAHAVSDEGRREAEGVDEARRGGPRAFLPEEVSQGLRVSCKMERHYQVLSQSEFRSEVGRTSARMPTVPLVKVRDEKGEEEQVYVFEHPILKHRTLTLSAEWSVAQRKMQVLPAQHMHASQGERVFKQSLSKRSFSCEEGESLLFGHVAIPELESYKDKFVAFDEKRQETAKQRRKAKDGGEGDDD